MTQNDDDQNAPSSSSASSSAQNSVERYLRMECLKMAIGSSTEDKVISNAEKYFNFLIFNGGGM